MARVGMHEAKTKLSQLVERALEGEEIVLQRNGKPVARIVPLEEEPRTLMDLWGKWEGEIWIADDFDESPDDIAEALGAKEPSDGP